MTWHDAVDAGQAFLIVYFAAINLGYLALNVLSAFELRKRLEERLLGLLPRAYTPYELPVSIVVPAYNEAATICTSVRSMLQLEYPELEVIVVNDGSADATLQELSREFELAPFPEAYRRRLPSAPVRGVYRSARFPNLRVIDKENGGRKADAANAGINAARYPLVCIVDADTVLERSSLRRAAAPFQHQPETIAVGGTVRIANGCEVRDGFLEAVGLPRRMLPLFQVVEYMRGFLFGRLGWAALNAVPIVSGAFGLFRREAVVAAGGYNTHTLGEDMELVLRLHRLHRLGRRRYAIAFPPDPICWTEAPESLGMLQNQRTRWQRGLGESLWLNRALICHPRGGALGWLALPYMIAFEWAAPLIEVAGYVVMTAAFLLGMVAGEAFWTFMLLAISAGMLVSMSALFLEEVSLHMYKHPRELAALIAVALIENFGYRQLTALWRVQGLWQSATGASARWGTMTRVANWQRND
ncbi:MAG TPA: glycosyltransferase [Burkholderiales bacterium]|jgi:cellulose synthase/poly-beta-1,6-N-acetylglucosamine synthase-like glycosyltransferase